MRLPLISKYLPGSGDWDPDRNCLANTSFNGHVGLGIVEGTFKTTFECGAGEATGTWNASKKPAKPGEARR